MRKILTLFFLIPFLLGFQKYTLKSGTQVIYQEDHSYPLVSVVIAIRAGSSYESHREKGLSHFLEHMLFDGTLMHSRDELEKAFADIGTYYNAYTRKDFVAFEFVSPPSEVIPALKLITEMIFMSSFPGKEFEKEKGVVYQEIVKDYLNPMESSGYRFYEKFLEGTPYEAPVLGYPQIIKNLERQRIIKFWESLYIPSRMNVIILGDFKFNEIKDRLDRIFSSYNRKGREIPLPEIEPAWGKVEVLNGNLKRLDIALEASGPCEDGSGVYEILAGLLGEKLSSILGIFRYSSEYEKYRGISFIHFYGFPSKAISKDQVKAALKKILSMNFSKQEISRAINDFKSSRIMLEEKKLHLAREIGEWSILCTPERREAFLKEALSATTRELKDAIGAISRYYALIQQPTEKKMFKLPIPALRKGTLGNGLKYALMETSSRINAFHVLFIKRPARENFPGQSHLLFKALEIQHGKDLGKLGINYQFTDYIYFPFDDFYLSKDYSYMRFEGWERENLREAICEVFNKSLSREAFERAKKEVLGELGYLSSMRSWVGKEMLRIKLMHFPYNQPLYGTPEVISSANYKQMENFRKSYFDPEYMIFTGIGDELPQCLKKLKKVGTKFSPAPVNLSSSPKVRGGVLAMGWNVRWDRATYSYYMLLAHILRDRIAEDVRERKGLAYSVSVGFEPYSNGEGLFYILVPTTAEGVKKISTTVDSILSKFMPSRISDDEFRRSKVSLAARVLRYGERKINRSFYTGLYIYLGLGAEYLWKLPGIITSLNKEKLDEVYRELNEPEKISFGGKL
ncbi:MAG: insulinase family protein [Candidatus Aminicenantes bacterium]|nr:insulinase family protein [Candidatus Aminicenantes bacterium]